ncbi:MAG: hypothetical protein L0H55_06885 [Candidatus Nitrosocosmicus sp.]|nr:hypothetical protein [Candidatus Nitrosocosmicus sp.]
MYNLLPTGSTSASKSSPSLSPPDSVYYRKTYVLVSVIFSEIVNPNNPNSMTMATSTSRRGTFASTCPPITLITLPVSLSVTNISLCSKNAKDVGMLKGLSLTFSAIRLGSFMTGPLGDSGALK